MEKRPLLVIMHDPPEVLSSPDPRTGKVELHNSWLVSFSVTVRLAQTNTDKQFSKTDSVKTYISEAVKHGFAVIDVNLPKHISEDEVSTAPRIPSHLLDKTTNTTHQDDQDHEETDFVAKRAGEATQLLTYLWENYIELADSTHIFLLGTNIGHVAITNWTRSHEETAMDLVDHTIHFIADVALQACRSPTNDLLSPWYYRTSSVWLGSEHNFWASDFAQKPKKKFGRVARAAGEHMGDMLLEQKESVFELLLDKTEDWRLEHHPTDDEDELGEEDEGVRGDVDNDAMEISEGDTMASARRLPPVGNFALSPAPRASPAAAGPSSRTPGVMSPVRGGGDGRSPAR